MKKIFIVLLTVFVFANTLVAQVMSLEELAREGARIGRQFKAATAAGDVNGQNAALDEIDAILATLKKQEQVDALTNAFNNCNVAISNPSQDALAYTMALGNAIEAGDDIGIEDANDIIATVRQQYLERSNDEQQILDKYFSIAKEALDLGVLAYNANGDANEISRIETQVAELHNKYSEDKELVKIIDELYGIFSIKITDLENDAQLCAREIIKAKCSGESPAYFEKARRLSGYYYKKYALCKGEEEAKRLNDRINAILDEENK